MTKTKLRNFIISEFPDLKITAFSFLQDTMGNWTIFARPYGINVMVLFAETGWKARTKKRIQEQIGDTE